MMNLFLSNNQIFPDSNINPLIVKTPFGSLQFQCSFNEKLLSDIPPQTTVSLSPNKILSSWTSKECQIEFLQSHFNPKLPSGMFVDKCIGGIWRLKTLSPKVIYKFSCILESSLKPSPESGESLLAQSFEDAFNKLSIGTEDEESLIARATEKKWLPFHFKDSLNPSNICYTNQGLEINFPEAQQNDLIQIHFIVAWASKASDPTSIATWYAVDQAPSEVLNIIKM